MGLSISSILFVGTPYNGKVPPIKQKNNNASPEEPSGNQFFQPFYVPPPQEGSFLPEDFESILPTEAPVNIYENVFDGNGISFSSQNSGPFFTNLASGGSISQRGGILGGLNSAQPTRRTVS